MNKYLKIQSNFSYFSSSIKWQGSILDKFYNNIVWKQDYYKPYGNSIVSHIYKIDKFHYLSNYDKIQVYGPYTKEINDLIIAQLLTGGELIKEVNTSNIRSNPQNIQSYSLTIQDGWIDGQVSNEINDQLNEFMSQGQCKGGYLEVNNYIYGLSNPDLMDAVYFYKKYSWQSYSLSYQGHYERQFYVNNDKAQPISLDRYIDGNVVYYWIYFSIRSYDPVSFSKLNRYKQKKQDEKYQSYIQSNFSNLHFMKKGLNYLNRQDQRQIGFSLEDALRMCKVLSDDLKLSYKQGFDIKEDEQNKIYHDKRFFFIQLPPLLEEVIRFLSIPKYTNILGVPKSIQGFEKFPVQQVRYNNRFSQMNIMLKYPSVKVKKNPYTIIYQGNTLINSSKRFISNRIIVTPHFKELYNKEIWRPHHFKYFNPRMPYLNVTRTLDLVQDMRHFRDYRQSIPIPVLDIFSAFLFIGGVCVTVEIPMPYIPEAHQQGRNFFKNRNCMIQEYNLQAEKYEENDILEEIKMLENKNNFTKEEAPIYMIKDKGNNIVRRKIRQAKQEVTAETDILMNPYQVDVFNYQEEEFCLITPNFSISEQVPILKDKAPNFNKEITWTYRSNSLNLTDFYSLNYRKKIKVLPFQPEYFNKQIFQFWIIQCLKGDRLDNIKNISLYLKGYSSSDSLRMSLFLKYLGQNHVYQKKGVIATYKQDEVYTEKYINYVKSYKTFQLQEPFNPYQDFKLR